MFYHTSQLEETSITVNYHLLQTFLDCMLLGNWTLPPLSSEMREAVLIHAPNTSIIHPFPMYHMG